MIEELDFETFLYISKTNIQYLLMIKKIQKIYTKKNLKLTMK